MTALEALLLALPNLTVLTLGDVKMAVDELCGARAEDADKTRAGHLYMPILRGLKVELDAVPAHLIGGLPLADALAEADANHDDCGNAIWFLSEACKRLPGMKPKLLEAVLKAQETFVPSRGVLRKPYLNEAQDSDALQPAFAAQRATLAKIPTPDGQTFADLVGNFLGAGQQIKALINQRADDTEGLSRGQFTELRNRAISAISNFRSGHIDELRAGLSPVSTFDRVWNQVHIIAQARAKSLNNPPSAPPTPSKP